ncbi:unnamed protein product [Linum tenue]|uniref:Uncharacterized protein n=1 Tax=Linum tenue TaxID=586396 RepID=A0AAV0HV96_9ROSI|nr:unnamed protein product [Linum tenue]
MRRAEEMKNLKKDVQKKGTTTTTTTTQKDVSAMAGSLKKKASGSDEERVSATHSQVDEKENDDEVQWHAETSAEAVPWRIQEQLSSATAEMVMLSTIDTGKKAKETAKANGSSLEVAVSPRAEEKLISKENEKTSSVRTLANELKGKHW